MNVSTMGTTFDTTEYAMRRQRVAALLGDWELDGLVITTQSDLKYLTGFDGCGPLGPNPFAEGPEAALVVTVDDAILCLPDATASAVPPEAAVTTAPFTTFLDLRPLDGQQRLAERVTETLADLGLRRAVLGVQAVSVPASVVAAIGNAADGLSTRDIGSGVRRLRMVKSPRELEVIRRAVELCDRAQGIVTRMARPGTREIEIFNAVQDEIADTIGHRSFIHEITSGRRSGTIGNISDETVISDGDLVLSDIAPPLDGYWGDSSGTLIAGGGGDERAKRMLEVVAEALWHGTEAVRPGLTAAELDRAMREFIGETEFPAYHNSGGHGIGIDYHEPPRLVPDDHTPLEPGMVLAMEPGVYLPNFGGVRLEHLVHVTTDGCEVLSHHLERHRGE